VIGEFERVLGALNRAEVRYLVVGGVAVVLHGYLRTTVDLDLVVQLEPNNARRALEILTALGYQPRAPVPATDFADADQREAWIRDKNVRVFSLWGPTTGDPEIDLFVREPFDFDAVFARAEQLPLRHTFVPVLCRADLIELKRQAGRPQDLADIEALEALPSSD
jgi:hypothetical protein